MKRDFLMDETLTCNLYYIEQIYANVMTEKIFKAIEKDFQPTTSCMLDDSRTVS